MNPLLIDSVVHHEVVSSNSLFDVDFLKNLLVTLIGMVIGILFALYINRLILKSQEKKERLKEEKTKKWKVLNILKSIEVEIKNNIDILRTIESDLPKMAIFYHLDLSAWKSFPLAEIYSIDNIELIKGLSWLYYEYEYIQRKIDIQFQMHYSSFRAINDYKNIRDVFAQKIIEHTRLVAIQSSYVYSQIKSEIKTIETRIKD